MLRKYAYAWITLAFFIGSFALHWTFGWHAFVDEARDHRQQPEFSAYVAKMGREDTVTRIDNTHYRHHGHAQPHGAS